MPGKSKNTTHHEILCRLGRGTGSQLIFQFVQIVIRIAEVPLFLGFWGIHLYGEWLMLAAIPTYLTMSDGGFISATVREMSMRSSAGNHKGALSVFQSTWSLLLFISLIAGLLAILFIYQTPIGELFGFVKINSYETRFVFLILSAHVLISFQEGLLNGGFWCTGQYPLSILLSSITNLFEFSGLAIALVLGGGPVQAAVGLLSGRLIGTILAWISLSRTIPWLRFGFTFASIIELKRLLVPAVSSVSFPLGNALNIEGMRLVVGLLLGPTIVAVFMPLRTLSRFAMLPMVIINRLIEPELAISFGKRDLKLFESLFARSCQIAIWTVMAACLLLAAISNWIFPIWTGGKITIHWPLFFMMLLAVAVHPIWQTALMAPYATNRHEKISVTYSLIYGIFALILGYAGALTLGLSGVGLALLIVELSMAIYIIPIALKLSEQSLSIWFGNIVQPPLFLFSNFKAMIKRAFSSNT